MIASPPTEGLASLDVKVEQQRIEGALQGLMKRSQVELVWVQGQTSHDLRRALQQGPWHIFHFIGHGGAEPTNGKTGIILANTKGGAEIFSVEQLEVFLRDQPTLRLAVFNSCSSSRGIDSDIRSSIGAVLAAKGLPAILAMQFEISDPAAIIFASGFYEALARFHPVDAAVAEARKAIWDELRDSVEWLTPVLYLTAPDGVLFRNPDDLEGDMLFEQKMGELKEHIKVLQELLAQLLPLFSPHYAFSVPDIAATHRRFAAVVNTLQTYDSYLNTPQILPKWAVSQLVALNFALHKVLKQVREVDAHIMDSAAAADIRKELRVLTESCNTLQQKLSAFSVSKPE
jgi:hypothetical protein